MLHAIHLRWIECEQRRVECESRMKSDNSNSTDSDFSHSSGCLIKKKQIIQASLIYHLTSLASPPVLQAFEGASRYGPILSCAHRKCKIHFDSSHPKNGSIHIYRIRQTSNKIHFASSQHQKMEKRKVSLTSLLTMTTTTPSVHFYIENT